MLSQQTPSPTALATDGQSVEASAYAPNLVVIGAMKASTTTFYELITRHPDIWFASEKEPHYFTSPEYGSPAAWQRYLQLFEKAPTTAKYRGEASTGYSKLPHFGDTPARIAEALDHPRFIYLVRDPVERTISNYRHAYLAGHYEAGTTLTDALERDPILIDASCYTRQIEAYHNQFGSEQLLVVTTDELHASPKNVMQRVESFLELPAFDGWDKPLPQSNSQQALGGSLAAHAWLPKPMVTALRSLLPNGLRNMLKGAAASRVVVPTITDEERQRIFELVADDLTNLRPLLGDRIANWPSVQKLGRR